LLSGTLTPTIGASFTNNTGGNSTIAAYADLIGNGQLDPSFSSPGIDFTAVSGAVS
jgi:hypothetical protein